ncbi:hypothetical protein [Pseudomonas cichorii]|uniref:hypothetical protein n=1 Tax=Pseudomonas cichorii TaxID=36746 RepID=UPI0011C43E41|nr:hypothetical protein [Pseudomonas cichorii]
MLDCSLYCQLAASARHGKFVEPVEWRQTYLNALTRLRCNIVYREVQDAPLIDKGSLWDYVREKLAMRVPLALIERAESTLKQCVDGTGDSAARTLLMEQTTHCPPVDLPAGPDNKGKQECAITLQLGFIDVEPVISLIVISFKSIPPAGEMPLSQLFAQWDRVKDLDIAIVSAELDEHAFGYFRKDLVSKLGTRRDQLIVDLGDMPQTCARN